MGLDPTSRRPKGGEERASPHTPRVNKAPAGDRREARNEHRPEATASLAGDAFVSGSGPASRIALASNRRLPQAGREIVSKPGDTLMKLAQTHLGDRERWKELYDLNKDQLGASPYLLFPNTRLRLPANPAGWKVDLPTASPAKGVTTGDRPLSVREYPQANPVGAHGIPNYMQSQADADFQLDLLAKTGAKNINLIVPFPEPQELREIDRYFLEKAKAQGVTVQLRLGFSMKPGSENVDPAALKRYTEQVAQVLGTGPYIALANEPNLHHEWLPDQSPDAGKFARWWVKYADAVAAGGGYPGLPGLAAGAYDTPDGKAKGEFGFYEQMLRAIAAESPNSLNRAWTGAHPYHMYYGAGHPDYVEDTHWQLGRFDEMNRHILGRSLPVLVTEGGYVDGDNPRRLDPNNADQARDVARFKASLAQRPDWLVVGTADWLLSNRHGPGWKSAYGPNGESSAFSRVLESEKAKWEGLRDDVRG